LSIIKKLSGKYKAMSPSVKMAFWYLMCNFFQKGIGMISTPLFTRIMQETEYGRYSLYHSWYNILLVFVTLSISGNCYLRGLVVLDDERKQRELTSSLFGLSLTLLAGFAIVYCVFHTWIDQMTGLTPVLFMMMGVDFLFVTAYQFWGNSKRVRYDYKPIVAVIVCFTVLRPLLAVIGVLSVPESYQTEARVAGAAIADIILFGWMMFVILFKGKRFYHKDNWKYALTFCIPLIPHYLSKTILNESDRIMIGHFVGNAEVGYYSVAYTIAGIMMIFNMSVAQSLEPWIYQSIKNKQLDKIGGVSYKITAVIALINFLLMTLAPEALFIFAPANYTQALWVIPPVAASVFFMFMHELFATFQVYYKKTKWIAIASCGGAVLNIILNFIFIPLFGFLAAGYTTLVCYILFGVLHYLFMRKVCKQYLDGYKVYDWRIIFGIGALLVAASFVMLLLYQYPVVRYSLLGVTLAGLLLMRKTIMRLFNEVRKSK